MRPNNWDNLPLTLGVNEVADIIGYGRSRVRELCSAGVIPHVRYGRAYRISRDSLRAWLEQASVRG